MVCKWVILILLDRIKRRKKVSKILAVTSKQFQKLNVCIKEPIFIPLLLILQNTFTSCTCVFVRVQFVLITIIPVICHNLNELIFYSFYYFIHCLSFFSLLSSPPNTSNAIKRITRNIFVTVGVRMTNRHKLNAAPSQIMFE